MLRKADIVLVGHPFAPIGRGEDVRCTYRALKKVGIQPKVLDLYALQKPEGQLQHQLASELTDSTGQVNIFHLNGNEIPQALAHLHAKGAYGGYNIIYPQWELSRYPSEWGANLELFDEVWAPTNFVFEALSPVVKKPLAHVPLGCQVELSSMLGRRYFGLPESCYTFLFFFDFRSYSQRKNPEAVVDSFEKLVQKMPGSKVALVIKLNGSELAPVQLNLLKERVESLGDRVILINRTITDNEIKNLVRCCDCFVSLHRSEGFGRGLAEAMFLGKPVIATGYSGNLDFMNTNNSFLIDYELIDLKEGDYPYWQGQKWADADTEQAAHYMASLVSNPSMGYEIGKIATISVSQSVGFRGTGLNYIDRVSRINDDGERKEVQTCLSRKEAYVV